MTVLCAILASVLGRVIWPPAPETPTPTVGQMPFVILFNLLESASLGLGIAFIVFGWPLVRRLAGGSRALAWGAFASIAWGLVSWWPHGNLHRHAGVPASSADLAGLLVLEYAFHGTLILGGLLVAYAFLRLPHATGRSRPPLASGTVTGGRPQPHPGAHRAAGR